MSHSLPCITLYPEHADAFRLGIRNVETRGRRTKHRGRIGIHAGMRDPDSPAAARDPISRAVLDAIPHGNGLTRGAIVATANLTHCAPIGGPMSFRTGTFEGDEGDFPDQPVVVYDEVTGILSDGKYRLVIDWPDKGVVDITDQLPFGDFSCGRWAWILDDIKSTTERCPWCWGERGDPENEGWYHDGHLEPGSRAACPVCDGTGRCVPIPARGQQATPWEWKP